jgi:hypothetical protein
MSAIAETTIEADPKVPFMRMRREFKATPEHVVRVHAGPTLFAQSVGPNGMQTRVEEWDARLGGSRRYVSAPDGQEYARRGCFAEVQPDRIVRTRSLVDSFEGRDASLAGGIRVGVNAGYAKLEEMIANGTV